MKHVLIAVSIVVAVVVATAATATSSASPVRTALAAPAATSKSAACSKVRAASVAAIVGHAAPALPVESFTTPIPATKQSGGVSAVTTDCAYGKAGAIFILGFTVTSKPLSISLLESKTKAMFPADAKMKSFTSYSGLGVPGFRASWVSGSDHFDEIVGLSGKTEFSAAAEGSLSVSKLAALAKLARKL